MNPSLRFARATSSRLAALALVVAALTSSACIGPWIGRKGDAPNPRPAPTLIAGYSVQNAGQRSLLDAMQDGGLVEFGDGSVALVQALLAEKGFALSFDKLRVTPINQGGIGGNSATAAATGAYNHPQSSYWSPDLIRGPFLSAKDLIDKVKGSDEREHYAFCAIYTRDAGFLFKEPFVELRVDVYDGAGTKVLSLRGVGKGESSFLMNNRSPTNLRVGLERAIASVAPRAEEPL